MAIIVIEGPDGAGKTTLAEAIADLAHHAGFDTTHHMHTDPPSNPLGPYVEYLGTVSTAARLEDDWRDGLIIIDRLHVGELVYGPIMRNKSGLTMQQAYIIDHLLFQLGATCVFVDAANDALLQRAFDDRGEAFVNREQLIEVAERYRALKRSGDFSHWHVADATDKLPAYLATSVLSIACETTVKRKVRAHA